jgi:cell division protein FtsQ
MSEGYLFFEDILSAEKRTKPRMDLVLKRVLLVFAVLLGVELVWFFGITPCMPLKAVTINELPGLDRTTLLRAAGIDKESTFISVWPHSVEKALAQLPLVESARVEKRYPDSVFITVKRRTAVAMAFTLIQGRSTPVYFDQKGLVFALGNDLPEARTVGQNLPIISGIQFDQIRVGLRIPQKLVPLFEELDRISKNAPQLLALISEIQVQKKAYDGFELVLYPARQKTRVRTGPELNEQSLRYMMLVLDVLASKGIDADEIDFRTGTVAYRTKEASSG